MVTPGHRWLIMSAGYTLHVLWMTQEQQNINIMNQRCPQITMYQADTGALRTPVFWNSEPAVPWSHHISCFHLHGYPEDTSILTKWTSCALGSSCIKLGYQQYSAKVNQRWTSSHHVSSWRLGVLRAPGHWDTKHAVPWGQASVWLSWRHLCIDMLNQRCPEASVYQAARVARPADGGWWFQGCIQGMNYPPVDGQRRPRFLEIWFKNEFQTNILYCATLLCHFNDVIMIAMASQITTLTIVYTSVYLGADQSKHQSSALLAFVREFTSDRWTPRAQGQ